MKWEDSFDEFYQVITDFIDKYFNPYMKQPKKLNLTKKGVMIINFIGIRKQCFIKEIIETFKISPSTASEHVERLYKARYVYKHSSNDDKRKIMVSLTDKGLMLYHRYNEKRYQSLREKFFKLNEKDAKELIKSLTFFIKKE